MTKQELKQLIREIVQEMDLKSLAKEPRDSFDPTDIKSSTPFGFKTKINPFDDKDFAMKSKVLHVMSNYIDRKKGTFVKDGISVTQKLVDEVMRAIGNMDLNSYNKNIKLLDKEWSLVSDQYPEINNKYMSFKEEVLSQLK